LLLNGIRHQWVDTLDVFSEGVSGTPIKSLRASIRALTCGLDFRVLTSSTLPGLQRLLYD
jgi:hypothetical protein